MINRNGCFRSNWIQCILEIKLNVIFIQWILFALSMIRLTIMYKKKDVALNDTDEDEEAHELEHPKHYLIFMISN